MQLTRRCGLSSLHGHRQSEPGHAAQIAHRVVVMRAVEGSGERRAAGGRRAAENSNGGMGGGRVGRCRGAGGCASAPAQPQPAGKSCRRGDSRRRREEQASRDGQPLQQPRSASPAKQRYRFENPNFFLLCKEGGASGEDKGKGEHEWEQHRSGSAACRVYQESSGHVALHAAAARSRRRQAGGKPPDPVGWPRAGLEGSVAAAC